MIRRTIAALFRRDQWEQNLDAELHHHVELRTADLVRSGLTPEAAARQARVELGSRERYKDEARVAFGLRWLDDLQQDARYAFRSLRRSPGFAITAILSMALGIGANTVVFSIVNSLLLRPIPVADPERLLFVEGSQSSSNQSFPDYRDFRDRLRTVDGAVAYRFSRMAVGDDQSAEKYWGYLVSGNYFDVLGLEPALGRLIHADDEKGGVGASPYAVLSYGLWQSRFQSNPNVVGRTVRINAKPYTVLGVAPRDFQGTESIIAASLWVPIAMQPQIEGRSWLEERGNHNSWMLVRAKANASPAVVQADLTRVAKDLAREYPATDAGLTPLVSKPGLVGKTLRGPAEQFGIGVLLLAGMVLLAACVNLAALLGARAADRFREIALRVSIGASRGRVVRQLLTESVVLTAISGTAGAVLAWLLLRVLTQWRPPTEVSLQVDVHPDLRVLLFSVALSVVTGLVAGLAPALQAWKLNTNDALKGAALKTRRWTVRDLSLCVQTAVCCVLVVCSLVAVRGLSYVFTARPGLNPEGVSVLSFDSTLAGYSTPDALRMQRRALDTVAQIPGVLSAAYAKSVPLSSDQSSTTVFPEDTPTPRRLEQGWQAGYYDVSPGYFRTIGTRLLAGREFTWNEPTGSIAIINETFARRMFGSTNVVGRHFRYFGGPPVEIIGLAEDGKYFTLSEDPRSVVFRQVTRSVDSETVLVVRSNRAEGVVAAEMQRAVHALDPALPLYGAGSLRDSMAFTQLPAEIALAALGTFGILAIMLAVTGIYGLASYSVSRRVREIGIRVAIGARPGQVLQSVLGRLGITVAIGSIAGIVLGLASGKLLSAVVYQASPRDPITLAFVGVIMGAVALGSALGPIRRAISIEPTRALRED
jgi:predicted permease